MQPRVILALATEVDDGLVWDRIKAFPMFNAGPIVKFGFFGREDANQVRPYVATRWATSAGDLAALVDHGRANCACGCFLQVGDIFEQALREPEPVAVVAIIGDSFHGDLDAAIAAAKRLRAGGTAIVFLSRQAGDAIARIAEATGAVVLTLPPPAVERIAGRLPEGLKAVAHFAAGDTKALAALDSKSAALLLEQIKLGPHPDWPKHAKALDMWLGGAALAEIGTALGVSSARGTDCASRQGTARIPSFPRR
jgi:hypothetical protein